MTYVIFIIAAQFLSFMTPEQDEMINHLRSVMVSALGEEISIEDELDEIDTENTNHYLSNILRTVDEELFSDDIGWEPATPPSDNTVWRYLNFTQVLSILERNKLWFSNITEFDDPYEGNVPQSTISKGEEIITENYDISDKFAEEFMRVYTEDIAGVAPPDLGFVNCWNVSPHQSAALWEQYLDSSQGVAICTTVDRLKRSLSETERDLSFGKVNYVDFDTEEIPVGKLPPLFHKRIGFRHENEYRVAFFDEFGNPSGSGDYVKVDVDELIDSVYVSPTAPRWFKQLVERVLNTYNVDCSLKVSDLYETSGHKTRFGFELHVEQIEETSEDERDENEEEDS